MPLCRSCWLFLFAVTSAAGADIDIAVVEHIAAEFGVLVGTEFGSELGIADYPIAVAVVVRSSQMTVGLVVAAAAVALTAAAAEQMNLWVVVRPRET